MTIRHNVLRLDTGRLDRAKRTGAGGARVPATIARTGVQVYTDPSGREVREYRPADEVFAALALESLGAIPVTIGHPGAVDASNWRRHAVGHVSDTPASKRQDGPTSWLETALVISDADALSRVASGDLVEVSMGYTADVVPESGVAPDGQRYDAVQRNIRFNHLALLESGRARAGRDARLRLDAVGNATRDDAAPAAGRPAKFDPYAVFKKAHADSYGSAPPATPAAPAAPTAAPVRVTAGRHDEHVPSARAAAFARLAAAHADRSRDADPVTTGGASAPRRPDMNAAERAFYEKCDAAFRASREGNQ